jgi:hypothetical protein
MTTTIVLLLFFTGFVEPYSPLILTRVMTQGVEDLSRMIKNLYSTNQEERRSTKLQILSIAKQSEENRAKISQDLTALLSQRATPYATWNDVADLLGDLRATEAIGELVKQLDYNDGTVGLSNAHWPAARALIKIGDAAVLELTKALTEGTASIRSHAARVLSDIGGPQARRALERALETEKDESVRASIRRSIEVAR